MKHIHEITWKGGNSRANLERRKQTNTKYMENTGIHGDKLDEGCFF